MEDTKKWIQRTVCRNTSQIWRDCACFHQTRDCGCAIGTVVINRSLWILWLLRREYEDVHIVTRGLLYPHSRKCRFILFCFVCLNVHFIVIYVKERCLESCFKENLLNKQTRIFTLDLLTKPSGGSEGHLWLLFQSLAFLNANRSKMPNGNLCLCLF